MQIDQSGIDFIKGFEGYSAAVYNDVAGKPTVGYGHLIEDGESFPQGVTEEWAERLLASDLSVFDLYVSIHFPQANQNQHNALVSFAYNLGIGSLKTMTAHGWDQIPQQMLRWDVAGGQHVPGLTRRRQAEAALFEAV